MTTENLTSFIADIVVIVAFLSPILQAGWRYFKSKRLSIPRPMVLAILLHGTVVYLVHINTDTLGISAVVSVMIAVLVYLVGDAYEKVIEESQKMAKEVMDTAKEAVDTAKEAVAQNKMMAKEIEEFQNLNEKLVKIIEEAKNDDS